MPKSHAHHLLSQHACSGIASFRSSSHRAPLLLLSGKRATTNEMNARTPSYTQLTKYPNPPLSPHPRHSLTLTRLRRRRTLAVTSTSASHVSLLTSLLLLCEARSPTPRLASTPSRTGHLVSTNPPAHAVCLVPLQATTHGGSALKHGRRPATYRRHASTSNQHSRATRASC